MPREIRYEARNGTTREVRVGDASYIAGALRLLTDVQAAAWEEGTWTPVVADASTGGNVAVPASAEGYYRKWGATGQGIAVVTASIADIDTTGLTGGNIVYVRGLPFAAVATFGALDQFLGVVPSLIDCTFSGTPMLRINDGGTFVRIRLVTSVSGAAHLTVAGLTSGSANIAFTAIYPI
jgi:hypothetical protein